MSGLAGALRRFFSRDDAGVSVPAMDGVLKPNNRLEAAERLWRLEEIDSLAACGRSLLAAGGRQLHRIALDEGAFEPVPLATFEASITCLAADAEGHLALGLESGGIRLGGPADLQPCSLPPELGACLTAAAFLPDGRLLFCVGSRRHGAAAWRRDLMERGSSGCLVAFDPADGSHRLLAEDLAFPYGVVPLADGRIAVAESWRHRIVALPAEGAGPREVLLDDLPAYPARLAPAADGGVWMALFAPRRQLFELLLREDDYRREMMATIDPEDWVGPALRAARGQVHPLQQGSVRQMGILKPWAPSASYGLAVRCDAAFRPLESWHSRADGTMHGITAVCAAEGGVYAAARGPGTLLRLDAAGREGRP